MAKKLEGLKVPMLRQASEAGQLFGSVTSRDIAAQASEVSGEAISRDMVRLNQNFKLIGLFPVEIALHPEVKVEITVNIARTKEEAEIQAETGKAMISQDDEAPVSEQIADFQNEDDSALADVLEEGAFEAQKEKQAEEAEAQKKADEQDAVRAEKAAAKAVAKAEAEALAEAEGATEEEAVESEESDKDE